MRLRLSQRQIIPLADVSHAKGDRRRREAPEHKKTRGDSPRALAVIETKDWSDPKTQGLKRTRTLDRGSRSCRGRPSPAACDSESCRDADEAPRPPHAPSTETTSSMPSKAGRAIMSATAIMKPPSRQAPKRRGPSHGESGAYCAGRSPRGFRARSAPQAHGTSRGRLFPNGKDAPLRGLRPSPNAAPAACARSQRTSSAFAAPATPTPPRASSASARTR